MKYVLIVSLLVSVVSIASAQVDPAPTETPDAGSAEPAAPPDAAPTPEPQPAVTLPPLPPLEPAQPQTQALQPLSQPQANGAAINDRALSRNFAGSVQLDYLQLARSNVKPDEAFAGPTVELSLKLAMDLGHHVTANVKVCYACHGFEVGMAYFDLRHSDELNIRVGRFTPSFGSFPLRHDPANHSTSDKPLMYDMGRMVRFREWNEGILPAPWVDNGVEVNGSHFIGSSQLDYAVYAMAGPKGNESNFDFDFIQSRSPASYYVDNNSEPAVGGRVALTVDIARKRSLTLGTSAMAGHYDADGNERFSIVGGDATLALNKTFIRAEYLARWTRFALGEYPDTRFKYGPGSDGYSTFIFKDGFDLEVEHPIDRVSLIARVDGMRRRGNVLIDSPLSNHSTVMRYTIGVAVRVLASMQIKTSIERYMFNDFDDETAIHLGIAGAF